MSTSERVSLGFHRLGLFLAAIPLLVGGFFTVTSVEWNVAVPASAKWSVVSVAQGDDPKATIKIEGFASLVDHPTFGQLAPARQQEDANRIASQLWRKEFIEPLVEGLAITLAISFGVYGLVRAIGWVIGGFVSS